MYISVSPSQVAWLRVDTQTILTIAGHVITKNHRISVGHGDGAWTLGLKDVGPGDGGRYMCQVNTEPMMSQTHRLQVVGQQTFVLFLLKVKARTIFIQFRL